MMETVPASETWITNIHHTVGISNFMSECFAGHSSQKIKSFKETGYATL
jgi:hypothetical protein